MQALWHEGHHTGARCYVRESSPPAPCAMILAHSTSLSHQGRWIMFMFLNKKGKYAGPFRFKKVSLKNSQSQQNWNALFLAVLDKWGIILFTTTIFFSRSIEINHILKVRKLCQLVISLCQAGQQLNWSKLESLYFCNTVYSLGIWARP